MSTPRSISADAYLASIVQSSDDAIISSDRDGVVTSWNPAAERLLGYTSAEAIGLVTLSLFADDQRHLESAYLERVWRGETISRAETVLLRQDGERVDVALTISPIRDAAGVIVGASQIARDISERRRAELAPSLLTAIVQSSDDAIISKDLKGTVTSWNRAAERLFGYTAAEMIGQSITRIIPPERLGEEDFVLGQVRAGLPVEHFETVRRDKLGRPIDISLTVSPIRNPAGAVIGASKIARDVTEQKRLVEAQRLAAIREEERKREALEAENRRVQQASRFKSEFVANMSHEFRTPLNSIIGFAELMADERYGPLPAKYQGFARVMLRSGQHLLQLINDILDLAKVEAGKIDLRPAHVELAALIDEVRSTVTGLATSGKIDIDVDVEPGIEEVYLDPARLKQVLYNYLSNAIKFTPDGQPVLIRVRPDGDAAFRIEVEDRGIGIKPEEHSRLFVEFQQLDASTTKRHSGTGLGLALTKRIVEAQGGRVGVRSVFGSGSTFFATLPRTAVFTSVDVMSSPVMSSPSTLSTEPMQAAGTSVLEDR